MLISWKSRKQPTAALSTCEAEYKSLASALQECIYFEQLLEGMDKYKYTQTKVYEDNQGGSDGVWGRFGRRTTNWEKEDFLFFLFYHGKSSFQCSRPIICHCPIRIVRFKSRFKWSRLYGRIHRRGKSPKPSPLTLMLKLFFSEIEPSMHFQWGFGTRPNVLASYVTEQRARRDIFDEVTC